MTILGRGATKHTAWLGALVVVVLFGVPLFVDLNEPELGNDEAIYSYAVDRILDARSWLTPRSIPTDGPFLEKPPLKFWLLAGAMKAGLLPRTDAGMRWLDALFGTIAFLYVYLLGSRLAGPVCGVVAVLVLFTLDALVFEHGLRSNNMDAAILLSYCGGVFHFVRWIDDASARARDMLASAGWFVLGFMTKFVAALFLPLVCGIVLAWRPRHARRLASVGRGVGVATTVALVACAPWFLYESWRFGSEFWRIIVGQHVVQRFTSSVDAAHLQPWSYYFTATWAQVRAAGSALLVAAGGVGLLIASAGSQSWLPRVLVVWGAVPVALISFGTSKLIHYAYPFWPPLALGAGLAFVWALHALPPHGNSPPSTTSRRVRIAVAVLAATMLAAAGWTLAVGPFRLEIGGMTLYQNSSLIRPLIAAAVLAWVASAPRTVIQTAVAILLAALLPWHAYVDQLNRLGDIEHPARAARDCLVQVERDPSIGPVGVLDAIDEPHDHRYYYYLGRTGPWTSGSPSFNDIASRVTPDERTTPVLIERSGYTALVTTLKDASARDERQQATLDALTSDAVAFNDRLGMIVPGPFRSCVAPILAAGGRPIWSPQ